MFNIKEYIAIINFYKDDFKIAEWILVALAILIVLAIVGGIIFIIYFLIRKYMKFRKTVVEEESLLEEVAELNNQVADLMAEKESILAMKVSQLGLKPGEEIEENPEENKENVDTTASRFPKLTAVDNEYANYKVANYNNDFTLEELVETFRNFAASKLKLYYKSEMIRLFISALASTKLVILQGISGTGKTSLAYAWGKFLKHDSCVASVQPSWRDRTELFGYFNEFTKKFNETRALTEIYTAGFDDNVHTIILDEMNLARVEYYFADLLSILEMPSRSEWLVDIVSSPWPNDPKKLEKGKLRLPGNLWYIGTINNDDSTFMVTDKVYDRAMPIDINTKVSPFKCREQDPVDINSSYLESLFQEAVEKYPLTDKGLNQVVEIDDYVIKHFRIAFGNRIMKQLQTFAPVYVACGGKEIEAIDYFIAKKILRKFDQLSVVLIRDEIDPFIAFLNKNYGKGVMKECIAHLENIKKSI